MAVRDREADVLAACLTLLKLAGVWAMRCNAGCVKVGRRLVRLAPAGTPDILACLRGRLLGIECKRKKGRVRPAQKAWLSARAAEGATCLLIDDVKELEAFLRQEKLIR